MPDKLESITDSTRGTISVCQEVVFFWHAHSAARGKAARAFTGVYENKHQICIIQVADTRLERRRALITQQQQVTSCYRPYARAKPE